MIEVFLKPGREKTVRRKHPWIYSSAILSVKGEITSGEIVNVISSRNGFLGKGAINPKSSIRVRMWTHTDETVDEKFIHEKLRIAINFREKNIQILNTDCYRLVYAESDQIPGLIVDRYADYLVVQFLTAGIEGWRNVIINHLVELTSIRNIYERSDVDVRELEGLPKRKGILAGKAPPERIGIIENGIRYWVDIINGQKTGFYMDQRENRKTIQKFVNDKNVLDCFSYTGGMTLNALVGGAKHVLSMDSSKESLDMEQENIRLNNLDENRTESICADVFQELRKLRDQRRSFDVVILDPPKFAPTSAQVHAAARGYKDINLLGFKLLNHGGYLVTFSCSGGISRQIFQKIISDSALDAGVQASVIQTLSQSMDHPIALNFPEGEYLKGFICQVK